MPTAPELAAEVKDLRDKQKLYFKSKDRPWKLLQECKAAESKVDKMVNEVLTAQVPKTGNLFEQTQSK